MTKQTNSFKQLNDAQDFGFANKLRYVFFDSRSQRHFCTSRLDYNRDRATGRDKPNLSYEGTCW